MHTGRDEYGVAREPSIWARTGSSRLSVRLARSVRDRPGRHCGPMRDNGVLRHLDRVVACVAEMESPGGRAGTSSRTESIQQSGRRTNRMVTGPCRGGQCRGVLAVDRATAVQTEWSRGRAVVASAEVYWLSTVRPDGRPHVTPLLGIWLEGAFYFCTGPDEIG